MPIRSLSLRWLAGVCLAALVLFVLLDWSTGSVDQLSREREERVLSQALEQETVLLVRDQSGLVVREAAARELRRRPQAPRSLETDLDIRLRDGDTAYLLGPDDRPLYATTAAPSGVTRDYAAVKRELQPLVDAFRPLRRARARDPSSQGGPATVVADRLVLEGQPAMVSVAALLSDAGAVVQSADGPIVSVVVRPLDGNLLAGIRRTYGIDAVGFQTSPRPKRGLQAMPLKSRHDRIIGYLVWRPFAPGSAVFDRLAPLLLSFASATAALILVLLRGIERRTRQLDQSNATAQHLAFHDGLTGLPNRALFEDRLEQALSLFRDTASHRFALLYIDLGRVRVVNEAFGHLAGHELIRQFAERLAGCIRTGDLIARLEGDQFAVIQANVNSVADVTALGRAIVQASQAPFPVGKNLLQAGISVGAVLAGKDGFDARELVRKAQVAVDEAKLEASSRFTFFNPVMDEPIRLRRIAQSDLPAALANRGQLRILYQPTYSAADGRLVGAEALLRWHHPGEGEISPEAFIPAAEEVGLIESLGEWVIARACDEARDWPIETLSINVSPVQLRNPAFAERAITLIDAAQIDPRRVEFEVTETATLGDIASCAANLHRLRSFGIRIALDDFGTGYSPLSYLEHLKIDRVKIDRSFVAGIETPNGARAIVRAIVEVAHAKGLGTTAEGVETEPQKAFLKAIGCDILQGFLLSHPVTAREFTDLLMPPPSAIGGRARHLRSFVMRKRA